MNAITSYIGPRIRPGTIQHPLQFAVIESRSCGEANLDNPSILLLNNTQYRYLTKMCDQVIVLLSREYSSSIVWGNGDIDTESIDMYTGNTDRRFTFEVSKRNEQEEGAVARPGFQVPIPFVVEISFLICQRCVSVTFRVTRPRQTVQLTQQSSCLVFCQGKRCKAF
jgi:hypothetical protein